MTREGISLPKVACIVLAALLVLTVPLWRPSSVGAGTPGGSLYGLDTLRNLDRLPDLRTDTFAGQVSSHDKTGLAFDGGHSPDDGIESYLYREGANYVIFDEAGPGAVTRLWFTWGPPESPFGDIRAQFFFDGESTPRVDLPLRDLFSGATSPFLFPLVGDESVSSGGYYSYVPMPFSQSLKISLTGFPPYYNVGFEKYSPDRAVASFTGTEEVSDVVALLSNAGSDPKPTAPASVTESGTLALPAGGTAPIFQRAGAGVINAVRLRIPQIVPAPIRNLLEDGGRVHNGESSFVMQVDPANEGVVLSRRLDFGVPDQTAEVYVDGQLIGVWTDAGSNSVDRWRDSSFEVPVAFTAGKSQVLVSVRDLPGGSDWTEFRYWADSRFVGTTVRTDALDVGRAASEADHSYQVTSVVSSPTLALTYPPVAGDPIAQQESRELLTNVRLQAFWDGAPLPNVDAPLGAFFGSTAAETPTNGLMMGMDPDGYYYSYFPMPFGQSATVRLVNESSVPIAALDYEVTYNATPYAGLGEPAGYFHATSNGEMPTQDGVDYTALDVDGRGRVVGLVLSTRSLPDPPFGVARGHLEGDERVYVDQSSSPALYGTGTEDYFNAGWYFRHGVFSLATHGAPVHFLTEPSEGSVDETGAYRLHLTDSVSFRSGIHIGLEHGKPFFLKTLPWNGDYESVTFWYGVGESELVGTDVVQVGNTLSEAQHGYAEAVPSSLLLTNSYYEGDDDEVLVVDEGRATASPVSFAVAVDPGNRGVILRRRQDRSIRNQRALVKVDGVAVGTWYDAGRNASKRWHDSDFLLPAAATAGKQTISITLEPQGGVSWSAYMYWVYSIATDPGKAAFADTDADGQPNNFDTDDDNDGCRDVVELGPVATRGGRRSPHSFWDFLDVFTGSPLMRDRAVGAADLAALVSRFGSNDMGPGAFDRSSDPLALPNPPQTPSGLRANYHPAYDRGGVGGPHPWGLLPPDGSIGAGELAAAVIQFGHSCS